MVLEKLKKLTKKLTGEESQEDYLEIEPISEEGRKVAVQIENMESYMDTERILSLVRNGNIVFVRIRNLRQKDINELKRTVEKIKKTCSAMGGDLVGVDEEFLLITPSFATIYRGKVA